MFSPRDFKNMFSHFSRWCLKGLKAVFWTCLYSGNFIRLGTLKRFLWMRITGIFGHSYLLRLPKAQWKYKRNHEYLPRGRFSGQYLNLPYFFTNAMNKINISRIILISFSEFHQKPTSNQSEPTRTQQESSKGDFWWLYDGFWLVSGRSSDWFLVYSGGFWSFTRKNRKKTNSIQKKFNTKEIFCKSYFQKFGSKYVRHF